ncbi:MAG: hypothetical protein QM690_15590 [Sphingobium sp.]
MPRPSLQTMHRVIGLTVGTVVALQAAPCMADQASARSNFAKRGVPKDYPASGGRFAQRGKDRSGPVDLASATGTLASPSQWRMCRECGYDGEDPKPFKAVGLRASFQPIGGTFSYRF